MTRRELLSLATVGIAQAQVSSPTLTAEKKPTRWELSAAQKRERAKGIVHLTHEPLDFLLRRGDHFDDEPARYERMYSPENLAQMADAGMRYGRLFFYKGFGLQYERPNMERDIRAAAIMHQHGMKVSIYMAGTMFTETLYREVPEAKNWEQRDQDNKWVPYGSQTYRHYACPNEPAYRAYLKRIIRIGVEEVKADEIAFDNVMLQPEPKSCRCPRCITAFHAFLKRKYPDSAAARRRFGLPDTDWIEPNQWDSSATPDNVTTLNDPVLQEWVRFRCESLGHYANDLYDYVKSLNSDVAVHFNIKGLYSFNRYWANAVYHPLYERKIDVVSFDTGGYEARIDKNTGALVSQIRSYKAARHLGAGCAEAMNDDLRAAVHMAFNYQPAVKGYSGAPFMSDVAGVNTPLLEFFRFYNDRYYRGTQPVSDVAVLHNWPSMAYSISATYVPATLMEQVLIQYNVPFDILFDEQLAQNLDRYQAVVLAGQECVSDAQAELLLRYAHNGGTVIIAGNTAQYNQWRERRRVNPFTAGKSERLVFIPEIVRADAKPSAKAADADYDPEPGAAARRGERLAPAQWVLPKNHQEIHQAVTGGLSKGLSITTTAPLTTVVALLEKPDTRETILHVINFDRRSQPAPFQVTIRKSNPGKVSALSCFSPEADQPVPVTFQDTGNAVQFTVPATRLYAMLVLAR